MGEYAIKISVLTDPEINISDLMDSAGIYNPFLSDYGTILGVWLRRAEFFDNNVSSYIFTHFWIFNMKNKFIEYLMNFLKGSLGLIFFADLDRPSTFEFLNETKLRIPKIYIDLPKLLIIIKTPDGPLKTDEYERIEKLNRTFGFDFIDVWEKIPGEIDAAVRRRRLNSIRVFILYIMARFNGWKNDFIDKPIQTAVDRKTGMSSTVWLNKSEDTNINLGRLAAVTLAGGIGYHLREIMSVSEKIKKEALIKKFLTNFPECIICGKTIKKKYLMKFLQSEKPDWVYLRDVLINLLELEMEGKIKLNRIKPLGIPCDKCVGKFFAGIETNEKNVENPA